MKYAKKLIPIVMMACLIMFITAVNTTAKASPPKDKPQAKVEKVVFAKVDVVQKVNAPAAIQATQTAIAGSSTFNAIKNEDAALTKDNGAKFKDVANSRFTANVSPGAKLISNQNTTNITASTDDTSPNQVNIDKGMIAANTMADTCPDNNADELPEVVQLK